MPAPAFAIRTALGEFGDVILKGQKVLPKRLLESGYEFRHADLEGALRAVLA
jgi:NAD dependent epimerase/dehydratase family enzyme